MDEKKATKLGYKIGYMLMSTICLCTIVSLVALTIKLLLWLF